MTEKELSKVYWLRKEQQDIEERLKEVKLMLDGVGCIEYKEDTTKTNKISNQIEEVIIKKAELENLLIENRLSILEGYIKIERYIETIENSEIRQIMRYRFLDCYTWEKIDKLMACGKDYSKKKYYKYRDEKIYPTLSHSNMLK